MIWGIVPNEILFGAIGSVSEYPKFEYSQNDLKRAGKMLASDMPYDENNLERTEKYIEVFKMAYSWRNSHIYPMRRIQHELGGRVRAIKRSGFSYSRVKRMVSIRKKLSRTTTKFNQIQDLGGCRAILNTAEAYSEIIEEYKNGISAHTLRLDRDYVASPKPSGYRGHHFVLQFQSEPESYQYHDRQIEVQVRTVLQHAWATALEAVGMMKNQDLKGGEGDADWLRLFALMASEFAEEERCAIVPGTPQSRVERRRELVELDKKLRALVFLENINTAISYIPRYYGGGKLFLIELDIVNKNVNVEAIRQPINAAEQYMQIEQSRPGVISVLTEIEKAHDLKRAFPNYFGDVQIFCDHLNQVINPDKAGKIAERATRRVQGAKSTYGDLSWLREYQSRHRRK
jgi:ppGpp synthetase/RelA/SpoT-type nucleotidyltranferase